MPVGQLAQRCTSFIASEQNMSKLYKASCQCGGLSYYFQTSLPPSEWPVRKCSCSFCSAHDHVYASDPKGSVRFEFAKPEDVNRLRFATNTADFLTCRRCGAYLGAVMSKGDDTYAVLNVTWVTEAIALPEAEPVSFEGESLEERLTRREARWTPVVGDA